MDKYIVYNKDLTKADTLILKNLDSDIKDVLSKPATTSGANGASQAGKCLTRHGRAAKPSLSPVYSNHLI